MPKYDFNQPFLDFNGEIAKVNNAKGEVEDYTYAKLAVDILMDGYPGDEHLPGAEKLARFTLAKKVSDTTTGSNKNYTAEEVQIIYNLAIKKRPTLVIGNLDVFINGSPEVAAE